MGRARALVLVLPLAACSRAERLPTPIATSADVPADASAPPAPASASAVAATSAAAPEEPRLPLPAAPKGTDPEQVRMLASICPSAYLRGPKVPYAVGCRVHPPFGGEGRKPDGKIPAYEGDVLAFCALKRVHRGAFTRAGARQAALVFEQCKDGDAWDMGSPGSVVVVEEDGDRYRAVATAPAVYGDDCRPLKRKDGTDFLACAFAFGAGPAGAVHNVFVLDLRGGEPKLTTVGTVYEEGLMCYAADAPPDVPKGISTATFTRVAARDVDADGLVDLEVDVLRAHAPPSKALDAKIAGACKRAGGTSQLEGKAFVPTPKKTTLVFRNDGTTLVPSPESGTTLARWLEVAPENLMGLPH